MFSIGDKVVYPMQGIGVIERIEDKLFSGNVFPVKMRPKVIDYCLLLKTSIRGIVLIAPTINSVHPIAFL